MYSIVLLTAITTSTAAPTFGRSHGCHGCYGTVSSCHGCYGCGGCYGGYGGYAPYSSYSGYANYSGYNGYNGYAGYGCYGCCGGGGGYYVPHYGGHGVAYGYHGGCYGVYGNWQGAIIPGGCFGCHGGQSGYGIPLPIPDTKVAPVDPFPPINPPVNKVPAKEEEEIGIPPEKKAPNIKKVEPEKNPEEQVRVKVRIEIPENGRLFVDDMPIKGTGVRVFQTPLLSTGMRYFYVFRIEVERNGQVISEQRRVMIEPGQDVAVSFPNLLPGRTTTARTQE